MSRQKSKSAIIMFLKSMNKKNFKFQMVVPTEVISMDNAIDKLIDGLVYLELKVDDFRSCAYNPPSSEYKQLKFLLEQQSMIGLVDRIGVRIYKTFDLYVFPFYSQCLIGRYDKLVTRK